MGNSNNYRQQLLSQAIDRIFEKYDANRSGLIDTQELEFMLIDFSKKTTLPRSTITGEELRRVVMRIDQDGDWCISKEELKVVLMEIGGN